MPNRAFAALAAYSIAATIALAGVTDPPFNPFESLKVGDWVKLEARPMPERPDFTVVETYLVTAVTADKVTYEKESQPFRGAAPEGAPAKKTFTEAKARPLIAAGDYGKGTKVEIADDTLTVNDRELPCRLCTETRRAEGDAADGAEGRTVVTKIWWSRAVPFGMVRIEVNGHTIVELVEWGGVAAPERAK